jgi:hypothetical protein
MPSGKVWILTDDWSETFKSRSGIYRIYIKKGFDFDGMTMPRFAWSITGYYPSSPLCMSPALIHDALYCSHLVSKEDADDAFLNSLVREGVPFLARNTFTMAVRVFGKNYYDGHSEKEIKENLDFVSVEMLSPERVFLGGWKMPVYKKLNPLIA